jgi:predicted dehydrogenase
MKNKPLRVAIAGYGILGKVRHLTIQKFSSFDVVAISDLLINEMVLEDSIKKYQNYDDMLEDSSLSYDVVFVCLTNNFNSLATIHALKKGAHVFCEKPPGRNVQDILDVIKVASQYTGQKLMYGFNHRYHSSIIEANRIIQNKELGEVINLRGVYGKSRLITFNQSDWRTSREIAGGGVLLDQGIHMVDMMRLFAGEFDEVNSFIENSFWNYDVEDNAYSIMRTKDGKVAMLNSSATQWRHKFNLDITLERGSLILSGILSGSKSYGAETITIVTADPENDLGNPVETTTRYNIDESWYLEIKDFLDCILEDNIVTSSTANDALNTMKLVQKIYSADKKWQSKL